MTGRDHWDLLLRRTALDGQCFVVGPNVARDAADAVPLHGRAAVVSPWGDVLAQCGAEGAPRRRPPESMPPPPRRHRSFVGDDLAIADVDRAAIDGIRRDFPLADWAE